MHKQLSGWSAGIFGLSLLALTSCATSQVASLQVSDSQDLPVWFQQPAPAPYEPVAYIETSGSIFANKQYLLRRLKKRALREGANGVANVRFGYTFWWPYVEGVAVKKGTAGTSSL